MLGSPCVSVLGPDPTHHAGAGARTHVLNGNAFQQDAIVTFAGWQYVCFYSPLASENTPSTLEPVYVHLARRKLPAGPWQTLVFDDYPQTTDDGHNTVQIGICPGDGTIHLSYDHHCDRLRYRHSVPKLALTPEAFQWTALEFTPTLATLPGLPKEDPEIDALLGYVTYPRFGLLGTSKLWFSFRTGKAGLGDDHLAIYDPASATYSRPVTHLKGVDSNPYIHGLDYRPHRDSSAQRAQGALHTTWVYRGFVWYPGWDDPEDTKHKAQAGPNSGENNHDLCFAYSEDEGSTWRNGAGDMIADKGKSIEPTAPGVRAFKIPKNSGLANQESQAVDHEGGVHVLNRDSLPVDGDGIEENPENQIRWKHYYRSPKGVWTQTALPGVRTGYGGKRGQVAVSKHGDLYFVLPEALAAPPPSADSAPHPQQQLTILKATKTSAYTDYQLVWRGGSDSGLETKAAGTAALSLTADAAVSSSMLRFPPTEPLIDKARLDHDEVLSVFVRAYSPTAATSDDSGAGSGSREPKEREGRVDVVVLDFEIVEL
ncbi:uncharacterized protein B0I36DRAFT_316660 [Microdochium trichocladiopsis]|uniref:Dockerin type 1 n=1 Tax=Microdochium trichocladiopsis TaxID=1682393 RepID=A0A9P8YAD4_9PEZI|nr:uncharacterized protein B0I36DRAFT_316660 [Microdochium trichocladiopsis]KAH7034627.1 hypothetical protein B0I36DRAFT_316660 [Microdochium trichocladiopsis]